MKIRSKKAIEEY